MTSMASSSALTQFTSCSSTNVSSRRKNLTTTTILRHSRRGRQNVSVRAEIIETSPGLQELCKCEIPPHIGRVDFVKQMYRWADMTYTDGGLATFGKRMEISAINENQAGETNGYLISVFDFKDGEEQVVAELICQMDQTLIQTYDTILPPSKPGDIEGIKKMNRSGKDEFIEGEFFVISRKLPTDETVGSVLKVMIKRMMSAINAYYAFGSPFSEEF